MSIQLTLSQRTSSRDALTLTLGPNVNLLLTPDLNVVQVLTIVIVVIVVNIVCIRPTPSTARPFSKVRVTDVSRRV